jgi:hypothetical protein
MDCQCGCGCPAPPPHYGSVRRFVWGHNRRAKLLEKFDRGEGCWLWNGKRNHLGYGIFSERRAHRVVYEHFVGPIGEGLELDHKCRVTSCVNPAHLEPVTHKENVRRGCRVKLNSEAVKVFRHTPAGMRSRAARIYGISPTTASHAAIGRNWKV